MKTAISEVASTDFSKWFLGHKKSSYWTVKEAVCYQMYEISNVLRLYGS